ncbi:hypothetical protein G6326_18555 [Vibrio cholerae]|nr:hypothetical protein [Vibrio cholerae]MDV2301280.1 hypothetical protein [Vibrio cholerae]MEE3775751.1 hypothetical protein [Vibrio cholerae]
MVAVVVVEFSVMRCQPLRRALVFIDINTIREIMKHIYKPASVVIVFVIMVYLSVWFRDSNALSEASLMVLITLSAIFSVLLPNMNNLKSFSITKGELILQEVKDSEEAIRELASATLELVESSPVPLLVEEEFDASRYNKAIEEVRSLTTKN